MTTTHLIDIGWAGRPVQIEHAWVLTQGLLRP